MKYKVLFKSGVLVSKEPITKALFLGYPCFKIQQPEGAPAGTITYVREDSVEAFVTEDTDATPPKIHLMN